MPALYQELEGHPVITVRAGHVSGRFIPAATFRRIDRWLADAI
jgi:hypothetical protein